jgi:hypothetical protein
LEIQAADADAVPARFVMPSDQAADSNRRLGYLRIGRPSEPIEVLLNSPTSGSGSPNEVRTLHTISGDQLPHAVPATGEFIVELGASIGLPEMFRHLEQNELERTTVVTLDKRERLPDKWYGYEGVDMVVVAGVPAVEQGLLDATAVDALDKWVRLGGSLMIVVGEGADKVLGQGAPLARFAPGEFDGAVSLASRLFGPIETFAADEAARDNSTRLDAAAIRASQWKLPVGANDSQRKVILKVGAPPAELPLIMRWPVGLGQVTLVGLDLHKPPFAAWQSRGKFLERLLKRGGKQSQTANSLTAGSAGKRLGFVDLGGQLRSALDQFEAVDFIPFWAVALLAVGYIALLFPLNYWLATRWLKRQLAAWILFPATLALFCGAAYVLANQSKGNARHVNKIDLVDIDLENGVARGTTWFNVFSPENDLYSFHVQPKFAGSAAAENSNEKSTNNSQLVLGWWGLAGTGLGGMSSAAVNPPLFDQAYQIDPELGTVADTPLSKWSSKSFLARWTGQGSGIEAKLSASGDRLQGELVNHLNVPLDECLLVFGNAAYSLGKMAPQQSVSLAGREATRIDALITKRRFSVTHDDITPYDRASLDPQRIIELMMFHEAAGGANYTGLLHRSQAFVDLTSQLDFGRAILVAHGPDATAIEINGQEVDTSAANRHTTIYRFIVPVPQNNN